MNTMTVSPLQLDYVTKGEFKRFDTKIDERFVGIEEHLYKIDKRFDELKDYVDVGFKKMEEYIDNGFVAFEQRLDKKLDDKFEKNKNEIVAALSK